MPYVQRYMRVDLAERNVAPDEPGELNYLLTNICIEYVERAGRGYGVFNDVIGALECAKLELYRRMVAPYEDAKMAENGDVYPRPEAK